MGSSIRGGKFPGENALMCSPGSSERSCERKGAR